MKIAFSPLNRSLRRSLAVLALISIPLTMTHAVEEAFPPTSPGEIEIKELPAGVLLEASSEQQYFSSSSRLFRPLFRYISDRNIAMTTPVEARIEPGRMYFWVREDQVDRVDGDTENVRVIQIPSRMVASAGARGAYSEANFRQTRERLLKWLNDHDEWEAAGEPFGVYWNGPFTFGFLKRYEVQVEVVPAAIDPPA